jgi:predicted dehydrogenase
MLFLLRHAARGSGPAILVGAAATENIVALCDVDEERSARGFAQYPKAKKYKDYRKMFEVEGKATGVISIGFTARMRPALRDRVAEVFRKLKFLEH